MLHRGAGGGGKGFGISTLGEELKEKHNKEEGVQFSSLERQRKRRSKRKVEVRRIEKMMMKMKK